MNYKEEIYDKAQNILSQRRRTAELTAQNNYDRFIALCPEAVEIQRALAKTGSRATLAVLKGGNVKNQLNFLKSTNLELQKQLDLLLAKFRLTKQDIEPNYSCPLCKDSGYNNGFMCDCYKDLLKKICFEELNTNTPLQISDFAHFSTEYYKTFSDEERILMTRILEYCKNYSNNFTVKSPSLLFQGSTGVGKTHLSLAIAGEVIKKGYAVVYGCVHTFALSFEKQRYEQDPECYTALINCDLLILDDLGVEINSPYPSAILYDVINTRIMKSLPTIISTNLTTEQLEKRYSPRLVSRFIGSYNRLGFKGKDIRQLKKFS